MFGKIGSLTKIFIKDFYQNTNLVSKETKKLNTKSIYFWMLVIVSIAMIYISYKAINLCISIGAPEIFVKFYMLFLTILLLIQITLICTNIFFFSKDLEFVLPLPVKSKELLIAKFNTILFMAYMTELIFGLVPLILYGFLNYTSFEYFVWMLLVLLLHPIVFITVISFFAIIIMKIFSFVKNKTVLQNIVSAILILLLFFTENKLMDHIDNSQESNYFITPIVQILTGAEVLEKLKYIAILITLDIVTLLIFVFLGQKFYLKTVLKNLTTTKRKLKLYEKKQVKVKNKTKKIGKEYVKKEIKILFKQPTFLIQTVLPVLMILITIIMVANVLIPIIDSAIQSDETIKNSLASLNFNTEMICIILGILQCIFSLSSISLTAISREGKGAIFMKYIPISYYKQFLYKNVIQVVLNIFVSIVVLGIIYYYIPKIELIDIFLIFIISIFINLINSYLMLVVDSRKPYLNWNSEYSVVKRNDNKSFQYALTIVMILIYMYLSNILKNVDVTLTLIIEILIFMSLFIIIDRIIKNNSERLFNKIL